MTENQTPGTGPEEVERRNHAALVNSLAGVLDLRGGLSEAVDVVDYTAMSSYFASFLDLEAGLQSALVVSTRAEAAPRRVPVSLAVANRSDPRADLILAGPPPQVDAAACEVRMSRATRRAQLLAAATEVFVNNGYHATAMGDVAERAGVSKPVLYQHFPGKLELYLALLESHTDELVRRVQEAIEETHDNLQRVRNAVGAYFDFVDGDDVAFRLVFESDLRNQPLLQALVERMHTACVQAIGQAVAAEAELDPDSAWLVAVGVVGISEHSARYWLTRRHELPKEEAVALTASLAWKGLSGFPPQHRCTPPADSRGEPGLDRG